MLGPDSRLFTSFLLPVGLSLLLLSLPWSQLEISSNVRVTFHHLSLCRSARHQHADIGRVCVCVSLSLEGLVLGAVDW